MGTIHIYIYILRSGDERGDGKKAQVRKGNRVPHEIKTKKQILINQYALHSNYHYVMYGNARY